VIVTRESTIRVKLNTVEVITVLKAYYPHDLNIQALPLNPSAKGVMLSSTVNGACGLDIVYKKDTTVPAPAPVTNDPDPA
jgi:hypothetical protein